jgi:hypothetical protein
VEAYNIRTTGPSGGENNPEVGANVEGSIEEDGSITYTAEFPYATVRVVRIGKRFLIEADSQIG